MASQMDTWKIMQIVIPWAISFVSICVTFYVAYMTKQTQKMLSLNEKKIQQIDSNLEHLREDLVRFYSAFSTNPKETMANVLVAYEILMANPLATDELRKAAYKVREFTTVKAMSVFGASVKTDSAIEPGDTYQSSIDELGKAYRQIVEEQNQKRANLLNDYSKRQQTLQNESLHLVLFLAGSTYPFRNGRLCSTCKRKQTRRIRGQRI